MIVNRYCSMFCRFALPIVCLTVPLPVLSQTSAVIPQVSSAQSSTQPSAQADESRYILGPGDQIEITVFGYDEYTGPKTILSDGTITLPVIGVVSVNGRTPEQLAQQLTTQLGAYLIEPVVTVNLSTLRPVVVNVAGEVQRPGPVRLRAVTDATDGDEQLLAGAPTVSSALMQAGGISQYADIRQVVVRHTLTNGETSSSTINLWDALMFGDVPQDLVLQDGDSIYVPRLTDGEAIDRHVIARSSLSPGTVRVRVVGEVENPGEVQVPPGSSLSSAVAIAGGPTEDARLRRVAFVRMNERGEVERQIVDLRNLTDNYQIQDGDVVIVPRSDASSALDWAGRILNPLQLIFGLF
jgi:polysaccharide biosynthesis/export protein